MKSVLYGLLATSLLVGCGGSSSSSSKSNYKKVSFKPIGSFLHSDKFDESAAEITAYHAKTKRGFVVNAHKASVDVLDLKNPANPKLDKRIPVGLIGNNVNSVAVHGDLVALAVEAKTKTNPGSVAILNAKSLSLVATVKVGALPDMVTFTPNGKYILCANEGEPSDDYKVDPEGSVSIIDVSKPTAPTVKTADFKFFNGKEAALRAKDIRIFGPNASAAQDLEPEYITVSDDSKVAYVSLQENNAIAQIDISKAEVVGLKSLKYKDHSNDKNKLDASNKDGRINIKIMPVYGMYQPDAIASYKVGNKTYLVTANEGDSREYEYEKNGKKVLAYTDETSVEDLKLASKFDSFCGSKPCSDKTELGKLKVTKTLGDNNKDGIYEALYSYGARSFSIWDAATLTQVYDSGDDFAQITAKKYPKNFNASNDDNSFDDRSDNKGTEPEGVVLGKVGDQTIAFIGLERISSIMAYDITNPKAPTFMGEINTRTFDDGKLKKASKGELPPNADGDLGPEGLTFISAKDSPNGKPLLFVGFEVSGTSRVFELDFTS